MFKFGIDGIKLAFIKSKIWILLAIETIILSLCIITDISKFEFIVVLICSSVLMSLEMLNTAIELICNFIEPNTNIKIKEIKDISAGAVLLFAITTFIIGCLIFVPKLLVYIC